MQQANYDKLRWQTLNLIFCSDLQGNTSDNKLDYLNLNMNQTDLSEK